MPNLGPGFYKKLLEVASNVGMKPEDILNVMALESGLDPSAGTGAVGLVQFLPTYLKDYGYTGTGQDFKNESGETQLIYVERLIKSLMKLTGGKPFKSAVEYYVGNFIPAALKIPGVQQQNPDTIICSRDPKEPHIPGVKINTERLYYRSNAGLDFDKDGNITYGDLKNKLNQVTKGKIFQNAIRDMKKQTGYDASKNKPNELNQSIRSYMTENKPITEPKNDLISNITNLINNFLQQLHASEKQNNKLYKKFLPKQNMLIQVKARDSIDAIEFSRVLCTALDEELQAQSFIHIADDNNPEIECIIYGPEKECFETIQQLTNNMVDVFKQATKKIGEIDIKTNFIMNKKSSYQQISIKMAELSYRKFLFKFA
jgi:hypothetical protein